MLNVNGYKWTGRLREGKKREQKYRGGREEFEEVERHVNLGKAAQREKLLSALSPTPSLPVPAVNHRFSRASHKRRPSFLQPLPQTPTQSNQLRELVKRGDIVHAYECMSPAEVEWFEVLLQVSHVQRRPLIRNPSPSASLCLTRSRRHFAQSLSSH